MMITVDRTEKSVTNHQSPLRNIVKERRHREFFLLEVPDRLKLLNKR